ncbi:hypothetical protein [Natrinema ejinorense]|uniref:Uncharacterized protein n=1 Tax=Natrinema ejinorense TaxID=373386 RepID=A0A2A5QPL8_9EURY|nr:hypothetical protein [Natrinema ejinorense]PCR88683.1 hypothetical protein CP557_21890 [Natrinema ejinorense]
MSTPQSALGSRENFWYDESTPLDELKETSVGQLNAHELRRLIRETTPFNIAVDAMGEPELRKWVRDRRENPNRPSECVTEYERARWKSHKVLREVATPVSKTAKHAPPDRGLEPLFAWLFADSHQDLITDHDPLSVHTERCEVELTRPVEHVPREYSGAEFGVTEYGQKRFRRRFDPEHGYLGGVDFEDLSLRKFMEVTEDVLGDLQVRHSFRQSRIDELLEDAKTLKSKQEKTDQDVLTEILFRVFMDAADH